jgi:hypothetical protein
VQHFKGELAQLGLGDGWEDGGMAVQASETEQRLALTPVVHLWRMFETNRGEPQRLRAAQPAVPLSSARIPAEPGGYWVELADADRKKRFQARHRGAAR